MKQRVLPETIALGDRISQGGGLYRRVIAVLGPDEDHYRFNVGIEAGGQVIGHKVVRLEPDKKVWCDRN